MFEKAAELLHAELSVEKALEHARRLHQWDRTYSHDQFKKTAAYCASALKQLGLASVERVSHPADGTTVYWDHIMPMAWDGESARLEIVTPANAEPKVLADWRRDEVCLPPWCVGTPRGGVTADLVAEDAVWAGDDIKGKIVLADHTHPPQAIKQAVAERGGIGVVSDFTESYLDTPDKTLWENSWSQNPGWYGGKKEDERSAIWCLTITPRRGEALRRVLRESVIAPRLHAEIRARLYTGTIDTVTGVLPGAGVGEILLIAHLYEPFPDDDAAGAAAVLEMVRAVKALVSRGGLAPLRRSIRPVFTFERYGLSAFLEERPAIRRGAVVAVSCDDPCLDWRKTGRPVEVRRNPDAAANFTDPYYLRLARHCLERFAPGVAWRTEIAGTDDDVICDPTVGIPAHWFVTHPGRYHHTAPYDWEDFHPATYLTSMTLNATFVHGIASADRAAAQWLGLCVVSAARRVMDKTVEDAAARVASGGDGGALLREARERLDYLEEVSLRRVATLESLRIRGARGEIEAHAKEVRAARRDAERRLATAAPRTRSRAPAPRLTNDELLAENMIPRRLHRGLPLDFARVAPEARAPLPKFDDDRVLFWVDGRRTALEIARLERHAREGRPVDLRALLRYFRGLERCGHLKLRYAASLTKADLARALKAAGIGKDAVVYAHTSLSHAGPIRGGAGAVIAALQQAVGPGGTLLMPSHHAESLCRVEECGKTYNLAPRRERMLEPWDPATSRTSLGAIADAFWRRRGVRRSTHPTHAVAAWGRNAREFVAAHVPGTAPCGPESPYPKMVEADGLFLFFGCDLRCATFLHSLEDQAGLPYMPTAAALVGSGGAVREVAVPRCPAGDRSFYQEANKVTRKMAELGIEVRRVPLGFSALQVVRARALARLSEALASEPDLFLCDDPGCAFCAWARQRLREEKRRGARG